LYENKKNILLDIDSYVNCYIIILNLYLNNILIKDIRKIFQHKIIINLVIKLLKYYYKFLLVFDQQETDKFPPYRKYNHKIEFLLNKLLPAGPLYNISENELLVFRKFLEENLSKGFIRANLSLIVFLVLFAKKPNRRFCFYIDYRALNIIIIKNHYFLLLIQETLAYFNKTKFYTKLNIIIVFNRICITEKQEYFIVFNIYYNLFEILVISFGLSNTLVIFQV
jgi:hypothetical protein